MTFIQKNPLTMHGRLERCWLFTFQTSPVAARQRLPGMLEPVTHNGYAFWNVVIVRLRGMRPRPLPAWMGVSYWHAAYRLYVRFPRPHEQPVEGLYFVRSDCDSHLVHVLGNLLTDFRFSFAPISCQERDRQVELSVHAPQAPAHVLLDRRMPSALPGYSAFSSLGEATAFLEYEPFGIGVGPAGEVNVVPVARDEAAWQTKLLRVASSSWGFFAAGEVRPEICYEVAAIDYRWQRGRVYGDRS